MQHVRILAGLMLGLAACTGAALPARAETGPADAPCVRVTQVKWQTMKGTAAATAATIAGRPALRLPCRFAGHVIDRASWDVPVTLDLSDSPGLRFDLFSKDSSPVSHYTLYLRSGKGWYHANFYPEASNAWCTITINKAEVSQEEKPAGWDKIDLLRISAWRGKDVDTEFFLGDIWPVEEPGGKPLVAVLRGDSAVKRGSDNAKGVQEYTDACVQELHAIGVSCRVLSDRDLSANKLAPYQLVVLPFNPVLPDKAADELIRFSDRGGKLLAFYNSYPRLYPVLGIQGGKHLKAPKPGAFSALRFAPAALPGAPEIVHQDSWNITVFTPVPGVGQVLAEWLDEQGQPSGYPAVLGSPKAIVMSHILLQDDLAQKRRMLLAMVNHLVPETGRRVAAAAMADIGKDFGGRTFEQAIQEILRRGKADPRVDTAVTATRTARNNVEQALASGRYSDVPELDTVADRLLLEAWCLAQPATPARFRAFWCHDAFGVTGIEWDEAIRRLAANGFTAIFPNMLWGGAAFYDSQVLPKASKAAAGGDQIAACLAACRKHGVQLHVWKVNWNLGHAVPDSFVAELRRERRLQAGLKGEELLWLCPSHSLPPSHMETCTSPCECANIRAHTSRCNTAAAS